MTDAYAGFVHGGVSFPLAATGASLLKDADPALYYALDFFAGVLQIHIGDRFASEVARTPLVKMTNVVGETCPYDPAPYLTDTQFKFPLLAVYRKTETYSGRTGTWRHDECLFGVDYIMAPLNAGQAERLLPILNTIPRVLDNRIELGMDPAYTPPGSTAGALVWAALARIENVTLIEGRFGSYPGINGLDFPAWSGTLRLRERENPSTFAALEAVDHETRLANPDEDDIENFADFASDVTPPGPSTA